MVGDYAFGVDQHGTAGDAFGFFPASLFHAPRPVRLHHFALRVAQQRQVQVVLFDKVAVALGRVGADSEHERVQRLELAEIVAKVACFRRTAGRVVLRIEIQDNPLASEIFQGYVLLILIFQRELRRFLAHLDFRRGGNIGRKHRRQASNY